MITLSVKNWKWRKRNFLHNLRQFITADNVAWSIFLYSFIYLFIHSSMSNYYWRLTWWQALLLAFDKSLLSSEIPLQWVNKPRFYLKYRKPLISILEGFLSMWVWEAKIFKESDICDASLSGNRILLVESSWFVRKW